MTKGQCNIDNLVLFTAVAAQWPVADSRKVKPIQFNNSHQFNNKDNKHKSDMCRFILFIYNIIVCNLILFAIVKYFEQCVEKSFEVFFYINCLSLTEMFNKN